MIDDLFLNRRQDFTSLLNRAVEAVRGLTALDASAEPGALRMEALLLQLQQQQQAYHQPYRVAVMGEFKAGKSTFLNSLLGRDLLKHGGTETTAVLTEITAARPGDREHGVLVFADHTSSGPLPLLEAIAHTDKRDEVYKRQPDLVQRIALVRLHLDLPLFRNLVLIDTPGLGKSPIQQQRTLESLTAADAVLWIFDAQRIGGNLPHQVLSRLGDLAAKIVVILNKADDALPSLTGASGELSPLVEALQSSDVGELLGDRPRFIYSSAEVLDALQQEDAQRRQQLLDHWGYTDLINYLQDEFLTDTAPLATEKIRRNRATLLQVLRDAREQVLNRCQIAEHKCQEQQQRLTELQRKVVLQLGTRAPLVEKQLEDLIEAEVADLFRDILQAVEHLISEKMDFSLINPLAMLGALKNAVLQLGEGLTRRARLVRENELVKAFRRYFPEEREREFESTLKRKVQRLLETEWQSAAQIELAGSVALPSLVDILQPVQKTINQVFTRLALTVGAAVAWLFLPGGILVEILGMIGASLGAVWVAMVSHLPLIGAWLAPAVPAVSIPLSTISAIGAGVGARSTRSVLSRREERLQRALSIARLRLRNQQKILASEISEKLFELNRAVAAGVRQKMLHEQGTLDQVYREAESQLQQLSTADVELRGLRRLVEQFQVD